LEPHEVYLGLVFLVGEFEIEDFRVAFTRMAEKRVKILDYTFFCQEITRKLSLFCLIVKFASQLLESSLEASELLLGRMLLKVRNLFLELDFVLLLGGLVSS